MASSNQKDYRSPGEILRESREERGLSVEDVAESTKISPRMLQALETDEYDDIAGPIYARSFLRTLSRFFSLDEADMFARLESLDHEVSRPQAPVNLVSEDESTPAIPVPATPQQEPETPTTWRVETVDSTQVKHIQAGAGAGSRRILWIVLLLVLVAATVAVILIRGSGEESGSETASDRAQATSTDLMLADADSARVQEGDTGAAEQAQEPAEALTPTTLPQELPADPPPDQEAEEEATQAAEPGPTPTQTVAADDSDDLEKEEASQEQALPPPPDPDPQTETANEEVQAAGEQSTESTDAGALGSIVRPGLQPPIAGEMRLEIRALRRADLWVSADGESRQRRTLAAGEVIQFTARDHFTLELPEPDAVEVFVDGERRLVPPGLSSEWLVYPN